MARKSRKQLPQADRAAGFAPRKAKVPTAIYGRLSVEDNEKEESMETQIALVQDYIRRSGELAYADTYFDNGFTGTNFKRPAFTRLMDDVRQKKIECIVVKDLSRFGRNYLEAGYYIETVFPFLGVRLIAVTDNFDSARRADMESPNLPIRNMVNALYAKDISKKVWTSLQRKKEAGYAVGSDAPFGYVRNPATKRNDIDPEAAFYVQLMFRWKLMGVPTREIAERLTLLCVPTPREQHRKNAAGQETPTPKKWCTATVGNILENQTYVGDTVNNKSTQKLFAGQEKRDLPKAQWQVTKNTHPAIVARDDFERVQEILAANRNAFHTARAKSEPLRAEYRDDLAGMVFCADCGRPMAFDRLPHGAAESQKVCYYTCRASRADAQCGGHRISEKLLKSLVTEQLLQSLAGQDERRRAAETPQKREDVLSTANRAKGEILRLNDKIRRITQKREQLYADYVAGVADAETYLRTRETYTKQCADLRDALREAEKQKEQADRQLAESAALTARLEKHPTDVTFDEPSVRALVRRIDVGADKQVRVIFGFRDEFEEAGKERA